MESVKEEPSNHIQFDEAYISAPKEDDDELLASTKLQSPAKDKESSGRKETNDLGNNSEEDKAQSSSCIEEVNEMKIVVDLEGDLPGERSQHEMLSSNHVASRNVPSEGGMPAPHPMPHPMPESQTQDSYFEDQLQSRRDEPGPRYDLMNNSQQDSGQFINSVDIEPAEDVDFSNVEQKDNLNSAGLREKEPLIDSANQRSSVSALNVLMSTLNLNQSPIPTTKFDENQL